jgi:hypothetical protein
VTAAPALVVGAAVDGGVNAIVVIVVALSSTAVVTSCDVDGELETMVVAPKGREVLVWSGEGVAQLRMARNSSKCRQIRVPHLVIARASYHEAKSPRLGKSCYSKAR